MAFWNRNKKNDLANEFREYYQPNTNERTGLAWVLALVTLVCALFLIVSLFLGGRWAYRRIANRNNNNANQAVNRPAPTVAPQANATPNPTPAQGDPTPTPTPATGATPAPQGVVGGATPAATPTPAPAGGLPSTGPDADL